MNSTYSVHYKANQTIHFDVPASMWMPTLQYTSTRCDLDI